MADSGERIRESNLDFFGEGEWRKRIGQLKQELRSAETEGKVASLEQTKPMALNQPQHTPKQQAINSASHSD